MAQKINLHKTLSNPITEAQWPQLQLMAYSMSLCSKLINQHLAKCARNRQYVQAQKAKNKIDQIHENIRLRDQSLVRHRLDQNLFKLQSKQSQEREQLDREWELKIAMVSKEQEESRLKRKKLHQQQIQKIREQLEASLSHAFSPDDKVKNMRYEENKLAKEGNFIEAQRMKELIEEREAMLADKHRKNRELNIKSMLTQITDKHNRDLNERENRAKSILHELQKQRIKKSKQMQQRHEKQRKYMKLMYDEEIKMMAN